LKKKRDVKLVKKGLKKKDCHYPTFFYHLESSRVPPIFWAEMKKNKFNFYNIPGQPKIPA
jgi:hypothetical protein